MTDSDLRELDGWIAEHLFGKTICPGEYDHILTEDNQVLLAPNYSSDPSAFALVKREIERRGWDWEADSMRGREDGFGFGFSIYEGLPSLVRLALVLADSEELAGCLAVKAAVEGSDG